MIGMSDKEPVDTGVPGQSGIKAPAKILKSKMSSTIVQRTRIYIIGIYASFSFMFFYGWIDYMIYVDNIKLPMMLSMIAILLVMGLGLVYFSVKRTYVKDNYLYDTILCFSKKSFIMRKTRKFNLSQLRPLYDQGAYYKAYVGYDIVSKKSSQKLIIHGKLFGTNSREINDLILNM